MTWEEAIKYCEEHECEECPAFIDDKRTDYQTKVLHYHCCWNLVDKEKKMDKERIKLFLDKHICLGTDKEISFEEQVEIQKQLYNIVENYDELSEKGEKNE